MKAFCGIWSWIRGTYPASRCRYVGVDVWAGIILDNPLIWCLSSTNNRIFKSRTPWSCGLICHVLDREVRGLNLAAAAKFWVKNETTVWKTNDWVKNETTVSDWVKNETTVRNERLGEKWNNGIDCGSLTRIEGLQVVAPSNNIVKY